MKNKLLVLLTVGSLFFLSATHASAAETLFVQPYRVNIHAGPSLASGVLGSADSGFQFVSSGRNGNWVRLTFNGKQGFIPAVQTAKTPPLGKSAAAGATPKLNARSRASSSSAIVAGMKGLTYEDRARVAKGERSDFGALDKVDALKISPEELALFHLEGGKQ
jgi:uncharacterized protein YgiM (DUF1202 family)